MELLPSEPGRSKLPGDYVPQALEQSGRIGRSLSGRASDLGQSRISIGYERRSLTGWSYQPYHRLEDGKRLPVGGPGKKSNYLRCDKFEIAFLGFLSDLDWHSLAGKRNRRRERQLRRSWKPFSRKSTVVADGWLSSRLWFPRESFSAALFAAIDSKEARLAECTGKRQSFLASLAMARSRATALESPEDLLAIIRSGDPEMRQKLKIGDSEADFADRGLLRPGRISRPSRRHVKFIKLGRAKRG